MLPHATSHTCPYVGCKISSGSVRAAISTRWAVTHTVRPVSLGGRRREEGDVSKMVCLKGWPVKVTVIIARECRRCFPLCAEPGEGLVHQSKGEPARGLRLLSSEDKALARLGLGQSGS